MTRTAAPSVDDVRIVHVGVGAMPNTLVVLDAKRRTYAGLARGGDYWHLLRPARLDDPLVGDGKRAVGELLCSCVGAAYGHMCYWTQLATALEAGDRGFLVIQAADPWPDDTPAWMRDAAPGEIAEVFGS